MGEAKSKDLNNLLENGVVKLGTAVTIFIALMALLYKVNTYTTEDALWKQKADIRMEQQIALAEGSRISKAETRDKMDILSHRMDEVERKDEDKWTLKAMREWVVETHKNNPMWIPFSVDKIN